LAVAGWPSLQELVVHDNPITASVHLQLPAVEQFLHEKLGIQVHRFLHLCSFFMPFMFYIQKMLLYDNPIPKLYW